MVHKAAGLGEVCELVWEDPSSELRGTPTFRDWEVRRNQKRGQRAREAWTTSLQALAHLVKGEALQGPLPL